MKTKAIRIDPGMLYAGYSGATAEAMVDSAVAGILEDARRWHVNTLFVFAFSPVYGAYYPATHPGAWVHKDFGRTNFLGKLINAAHPLGIKVVASFHFNWFLELAKAHPDWVSVRKDGKPYVTEPFGKEFPIHSMSAHVPAFANWLEGLLADAVKHLPGLHGLEATEVSVAENGEWGDSMPDFHPLAKASYMAAHPGHVFDITDPLWFSHRSAALTALHARMKKVADASGLASFAIHDLSTQQEPAGVFTEWLTNPANYAKGCGFDWDAVVELGFTPILSAIWQQRQHERVSFGRPGSLEYTPLWTSQAAQQWATVYPNANRMLHVEVTPWIGDHPKVTPTAAQFGDALEFALAGSQGTTVYSYDQLKVAKSVPYVDNDFARELQRVYSA